MTYRIGLDIGTTATKACAFGPDQRMIGFVEADYELRHPTPGAAVQDAETVFRAAEAALTQLVRETAGRPTVVGLSCPMHSVLLLDADYRPVSDVITWADARGQVVMKDYSAALRRDLHARTGTPVHPMTPLVTLRWVGQTQPRLVEKAVYYADLKSALVHRWTTDGLLIDEQLGSATGMMDLATSEWLPEALETVPCTVANLPAIRPANTRLSWRADVAQKLGLTGVPLYLGGSDGVLANLGSGILECGDVAMSIGTSGAVRTTHAQCYVDPRYGLFNYKMEDGLYVVGGATNNGGKVIAYWQQLLAAHFGSVAEFIDCAMTVDPADCPQTTPWINGERAPIWDAAATASLTGLRGYHKPAHLARAVLEGVTDNIIDILFQLEAVTGPTDRILASGGFTRSPEWVDLIAKRSGRAVEIADASQASAYGAALVCDL